jgi:hypothetical protein
MAKIATRTATKEWLTKNEAAALMKVGTRQVEKRAKLGWIEKRTLPRFPNETQARVEYSRRDIEALLSGAPNMHGEAMADGPAAVSQTGPIPQTRQDAPPMAVARVKAPRDEFGALALHLASLAAKYPAQPKLWLPLVDAADYSGLPKAWLLKQAEAGLDPSLAINVGTDLRHRWLFSREGLAKISS